MVFRTLRIPVKLRVIPTLQSNTVAKLASGDGLQGGGRVPA